MDEDLLAPVDLPEEETTLTPEDDFGDETTQDEMHTLLGLTPKGSKPSEETPEEPVEEFEALPEPQEAQEAPQAAPDANQALLEELRALRAEVAAQRASQAPVAPEAPEAPPVLELTPEVFLTDEEYEEAVKDGPSLNAVLNKVHTKAVATAYDMFMANLPAEMSKVQQCAESLKSEALNAGQRFYEAHKADMDYVNADPRRASRFLMEVQRVQAAQPELLQTRQLDKIYGLALSSFNTLKADFAAADAATKKVVANAPKPAFATTPGSRGGLQRGRLAKADDAVSEMHSILGLKPKP